MRDHPKPLWRRLLPAAFAAVTTLAGACALAEELRLSTAIDVSRGNYGLQSNTDTVAVPLTLQYRNNAWIFKTTLVGLRVDSPSGITTGGRGDVIGTGAGGRDRARTRNTGMGDTSVSATYAAPRPLFARIYFDATVALKLPTGDVDRGLGTGTADWTFKLDAFRSLGAWTPFATVGLRRMGDSDRFDFRNAVLLTLGTTYRVAPGLGVGALLDWRSPISRSGHDRLEVVPFLSWQRSKRLRVGGYGVIGLADGSPDFGLGAQVEYRFPIR